MVDDIVSPEDVLPDGVDGTVLNGVQVRKGSVAAFVANAKNLQRLAPGTEEHGRVSDQLRALAPAVAAVGLFDVFEARSPELRKIIAAG
ncbi:hypothetical protein GCM10027176_24330 [Actinoallomurus bryophytorum]|uniref:Preprotein translocase subunit SecD n=1 Tax=Actinoallomurus bryophytorum TaxID=1490222 RepID=A0A543CNB3_9ACTN|nr:hypothetical protein [Actinoallomurus bryophytorum]TQL98582.1 hypothetical protein FB559_4209 [Actinoallomurus bryophytorum]